MRPAAEADRAGVLARLQARRLDQMFALTNLSDHGWAGDAPRAMRFWVAGDDVLGVTNEGMLMPCFEGGVPDGVANALAGRVVIGAAGRADAVTGLLGALGLSEHPATLKSDEPQFLLSLSDLTVPEGSGEIVPLGEIALETAVAWRAAYAVETLGMTKDAARAEAEAAVPDYISTDRFRALVVGGQPVAMSGLNARLPEMVQLGGIYTPPELRRRGYARRAVALHLAELRERGVGEATLFAANAPAVRSYEAIGFTRIGSYMLVLFETPAVVL